jgi:hypothetical protein
LGFLAGCRNSPDCDAWDGNCHIEREKMYSVLYFFSETEREILSSLNFFASHEFENVTIRKGSKGSVE